MESYVTVKEYASYEYEDRKSVFIAECMPVKTEDEALDFLGKIKKKYPDAKHHVYAYVLRENSTMRYSDDREPQGTAGMPVLDAIRKNGCTDVVIVVTRYFGGTLLGTGGLVHAYGSSAVGALEAASIITYDTYAEISVEVSYSDYQKILPIIEGGNVRVTDTSYLENVTVFGKILKDKAEPLFKNIIEATSARAECKIMREIYDF